MNQIIWNVFKDLCFTFYFENHVEVKFKFSSSTFFENKNKRDYTKKLKGKSVYFVMLCFVWKDYSSWENLSLISLIDQRLMFSIWRSKVLLKRTRSFDIRNFFYFDDMYFKRLFHSHSIKELLNILLWNDTHLSYDFLVSNWLSNITQSLKVYVFFEDMKFCISKVNLWERSFYASEAIFVTQITWLALARARTFAMNFEYDACAWRAY